MNNHFLTLTDLSKTYKLSSGDVYALSAISLSFPKSGFVFINGISGSGKTTLMNLLSGIDKPTDGKIFFGGKEISGFSEKEWAAYRNLEVGIVFQTFNLIDDSTVKQNLLLPLTIQGIDDETAEKTIEEALAYVGLPDFQNRKSAELSAGQKQRVAIARALIKNPKIILADEAMGNLDPVNSEAMLRLFSDIAEDRLVILISHDQVAAENYGDRIITLSDGKVISDIDNTKKKNLYNKDYQVDIEVNGEEDQLPLNKFNLKEEMMQKAEWNGSFFAELSMKLKVAYKNVDKPAKKKISNLQNGDAKPTKLPLKTTLLNAVYPIRKRVFRTILTIILIAFVCSLFHIAMIISTNDFNRVIADYVLDSEYEMVAVKQSIQTKDGEESITRGKQILEMIESVFGHEYAKRFSDRCYAVNNGREESLDLISAESEDVFEQLEVQGRWPHNGKEIVISKTAAISFDASIHDKIDINDVMYDICGICSGKIGGVQDKYAIVPSAVAESYLENKQSISLQGVDITCSTRVADYAYYSDSIGTILQLQDPVKLKWGRMPTANNEFLISDLIAAEMGDDLFTGSYAIEYRLPNLYDDKYNGLYGMVTNLFDFTGKKVEIVGVYDSEMYPDCSDFVVMDDVFQLLKRDYAQNLNYQDILVFTDGDLYEKINGMSDLGVEISEEEICDSLYEYKHMTETENIYLVLIIAVIAIMVVFLLISFLTYNVNDQSRRIGIFRVVGVSRKDVRRIYLINSFITSVFSVVLSCVSAVILTNLLNQFMQRASTNEWSQAVDTFVINYSYMAIRAILILILCVVVTIIPLRILFRKKVISLLAEQH